MDLTKIAAGPLLLGASSGSKRSGHEVLRRLGPSHSGIVRISWIFGLVEWWVAATFPPMDGVLGTIASVSSAVWTDNAVLLEQTTGFGFDIEPIIRDRRQNLLLSRRL